MAKLALEVSINIEGRRFLTTNLGVITRYTGFPRTPYLFLYLIEEIRSSCSSSERFFIMARAVVLVTMPVSMSSSNSGIMSARSL